MISIVLLVSVSLLAIGCSSFQSLSPSSESHDHSSSVPLAGPGLKSVSSKEEEARTKIKLHATMGKYVDQLVATNSLYYFDVENGSVIGLIPSENHPEIFRHKDDLHYVLCLSAIDSSGHTYPVDVYINNVTESQGFSVFDHRVGDQERSMLMALMGNGFYKRF